MFTNIALLAICLFLAFMYWRLNNEFNESKNQAKYWFEIAGKNAADYAALDKGMTELQDAYETDSLQYEETIENLNKEKARFNENNTTLLHNARIDRIARHNQERMIHHLREDLDHVKRQLDIAQVVISEHDLNCLPHIVLKSMEPKEQDTPLPI